VHEAWPHRAGADAAGRCTREQETEQILAPGAWQQAGQRRPDGGGWITLAGPEGNVFCTLAREPAGSGATA
jgi:hypothetical protein